MKLKHREGKRCGEAKYIWNDGSIEISVFDDDGIQNGPAKLTWPNGAIREGSKVNMIKFNRYFWNTEIKLNDSSNITSSDVIRNFSIQG